MYSSRKLSGLRSILLMGGAFLLALGVGSCANQEETQPSWNFVDPATPDALKDSQGDDDPPAASRWPMHLETADSQITIYQPQLIDFDGDKLSGRAAVSVTKIGQTEPTFGAIWLQSRVATDRVSRTVQILEVTVTRTRFPDGVGLSEQALTAGIREAAMRSGPMTLSLDQLLEMTQVVQKERQAARELENDPPKIVFRNHPAVLVVYDGAPRLVKETGSTLMRAVNTPFFVVLDSFSRNYYLKGGGLWFEARDPMGPFQSASRVPLPVAALAESSGYTDPQQKLSVQQAEGLEIITAKEPTELIWTDGAEQMSTIPETALLYVANTESDVFVMIDTQQLFVLLSGRWYSASSREGPWTYVAPDQLPEDFKRIPPTSEKGDVLAHVAGTQAATDAVADTFVPQTAAIDRKTIARPVVEYDGEPTFEPVEQTQLRYAVNTPYSVLLCDGRYYCCYQAVWYVGLSARGPWEICTTVPLQIYTIPPSCPLYPVRFVYVYDWTPDLVYVGYLPGYLGCYHYHGVVVFGSGCYYRPWFGHYYYPRPCTFGFGARYDGYHGHWGFSIGFGADFGVAWFGQHREPYRWAGGWFGHGGYRLPFPHSFGSHRQALGSPVTFRNELNIYARRPDVRSATVGHRPGEARPAAARPSGVSGREPPHNNIFADPNGSVYRKGIDGWERRDHDRWVPAPKSPAPARPSPTLAPRPSGGATSDLNRDYRARINGENRVRSYPGSTAPRGGSPGRESSSGAPSGGHSSSGTGGSHGDGSRR